MAMNEQQAIGLARELLVTMAQSGALKVPGVPTGGIASETRSVQAGEMDGSYIASMYRQLVKEFQK